MVDGEERRRTWVEAGVAGGGGGGGAGRTSFLAAGCDIVVGPTGHPALCGGRVG